MKWKVLIFVIVVNHSYGRDGRKILANLKAYFDPELYWPLDNQPIKEIKNNALATVRNNVTHEDSFITFPLHETSIILGEYKTNHCFVHLANCLDGITIGFWLRLEKGNSMQNIQLLTFLGDQDSEIAFWILYESGTTFQPLLAISMKAVGDYDYQVKHQLQHDTWYYVASMYKQGKMSAYINNVEVTANRVGAPTTFKIKNQHLQIVLGALKPRKVIDPLVVSMQKVTVWNRLLNESKIIDLYKKDAGWLTIIPSCLGVDGLFIFEWSFADSSNLRQVKSYTVRWESEVDKNTAVLPPSYKHFNVEVFKPSKRYSVKVVANLHGSMKLFTKTFGCSSGMKNGSKLDVVSLTNDTLRMRWKSDKSFKFKIGFKPLVAKDYETYNFTAELFEITNLEPNTSYNLFVTKYNGRGVTITTRRTFNTLPNPKFPRAKTIEITKTKPDTVFLNVKLEEPKRIDILFFKIQLSTVTNGNKTTMQTILNLNSTTSSDLWTYEVTLTGLRPLTLYTMKLSVGNGKIFGAPTSKIFKTKALPDVVACDTETSRGIVWFSVVAGVTSESNCPAEGMASRTCNSNGLWEDADLSKCVSKHFIPKPKLESAEEVQKEMSRLNEHINENLKFGGDIAGAVQVLDTITKSSHQIQPNHLQQFTQSVLDAGSILLDRNKTEMWKDIPQEKRSQDASKLLQAADDIIETSVNLNKSTVIVSKNIVLYLQKLEEIQSVKIEENFVDIPNELIHNGNTLAVAKFNGIEDLIGVPEGSELRSNSTNLTLNSQIMTVSVFPKMKAPFEQPVVIVQKKENIMSREGSKANCVYLDEHTAEIFWSDKGCFVHQENTSHVVCHCHHLTNFAVLMSVTGATKKLPNDHYFVMSMMTIVGLCISLVALVLAFITFQFIRRIQSIRNIIHQNLCVALFIAELLFLLGVNKTQYKLGCQVIAASLHYFFLVAFFLMAFEGIVLYLMLVRVYRLLGNATSGAYKYMLLCWALPSIFIVINLFIDDNAYGMHNEHCWLSVENGFIWSFVGPVIVIILVNLFILISSLRVMAVKAKKRASNAAELWFWMKGTCLLLCILGSTWILGLFYINNNTVLLGYLFTIINSLQGLSIFIFHCVCDARVRKEWQELFCCERRNVGTPVNQSGRTSTFTSVKFSISKKITLSRDKTPQASSTNNSIPSHSFGMLTGKTKI